MVHLLFWVVAHIWTRPPPSGRGMSSVSSSPEASCRENLQPDAEPVAVNPHVRDTVVLRNVILAFWTSLVTGGEEREQSEEKGRKNGGR